MTVHRLRRGADLTREGESALAELLHLARVAAAQRATLAADASYWQAAETRSAMALARADEIVGGCHDPRTLLATLVACVARADLASDGTLSPLHAATSRTEQAFGPTDVTSWVRRISSGRSPAEVYSLGAIAAADVLSSSLDSEVLAAAWTAACGISMLELLRHPHHTRGAHAPSASEARLLRQATCHCLARNRHMTAVQLSRLAGTDRRSMSTWLRYGAPSPRNVGHLVPARHCTTIIGVPLNTWHSLHHSTDSRSTQHPIPGPVVEGRALAWDEGEVMEWFENHGAAACKGQCRRHDVAEVPVAARAAVDMGPGLGTRMPSDQNGHRWLRAVR